MFKVGVGGSDVPVWGRPPKATHKYYEFAFPLKSRYTAGFKLVRGPYGSWTIKYKSGKPYEGYPGKIVIRGISAFKAHKILNNEKSIHSPCRTYSTKKIVELRNAILTTAFEAVVRG